MTKTEFVHKAMVSAFAFDYLRQMSFEEVKAQVKKAIDTADYIEEQGFLFDKQ